MCLLNATLHEEKLKVYQLDIHLKRHQKCSWKADVEQNHIKEVIENV